MARSFGFSPSPHQSESYTPLHLRIERGGLYEPSNPNPIPRACHVISGNGAATSGGERSRDSFTTRSALAEVARGVRCGPSSYETGAGSVMRAGWLFGFIFGCYIRGGPCHMWRTDARFPGGEARVPGQMQMPRI